MAFKLVAFATLVAAANAGVLPVVPLAYVPAGHYVYSAPIAKEVAVPETKAHEIEYNHHPEYAYSYDVHDVHTGDVKKQEESRHGDIVKGSYSLIEADGTRRVVDYSADVHGFNAIVHKEPTTHEVKHIAAAPIAHASPIEHAAPIAHAAPIHYETKYSDATLASQVNYKAPEAHYSY